MNFSVLMSAYKNDNADDFRLAVESVSLKQTLQPDEIVIVVDGPVPDGLSTTIKELENEIHYVKIQVHPTFRVIRQSCSA